MRRVLATALLSLVSLTGCPSNTFTNPVPASRLYFPTGVVHVDAPGSTDGVLFVASSNTDKRYTSGAVVAINLDEVQELDGGMKGLPPFGAPVTNGARQFTVLNNGKSVQVTSFTGEMAKLQLGPNRYRLFVPSRSEGMKFQAVDADTSDPTNVKLSCFPAAPDGAPSDCGTNAPSLSIKRIEQSATGVPRATSPFGVAIKPRRCTTAADCGDAHTCGADGFCLTASAEPLADVFITHLTQVDTPLASGTNLRGYAVRVESDAMTVDETNYTLLGGGATNSAAAGKRWVYLTGRYITSAGLPNLLRMVDVAGNEISSGLEQSFQVADARGIALGTNEQIIYVLGRSPDVLLVMRIADPVADVPQIQLVRAVRLPNAPNELKVLSRAGKGDLVAITCSGSGALAIYDEDVGDLVAQVSSVGLQPFGLDVDLRGAGARFFVSNYNDGRVAVIDLPDLARPQAARLVAHLGEQQLCLTRPTTTAGCTTNGVVK